MRLTDASIFSRALTTIEVKGIERFLLREEKELVIGRLTSMSGEVIKYANVKVIPSPTKLQSGNIIEEVSKGNVYSYYRVAPGISFSQLFQLLRKQSVVPVLFPLYLEGTVGGFIATNGSGFGSYKFGFVRGKKEVHRLENNEAYIMASNYTEVIETDTESKYAWSGLIIDKKEVYYLPPEYAKLENISEKSVDTYKLVEDINSRIIKSFKRDYFPVMLRFPPSSIQKLSDLRNFEEVIGYIINYNSPDKFYVLLGMMKYEDLPDLASFLKKNSEFLPFPSLTEYDKIHIEILNRVGKRPKLPRDFKDISDLYVDALKCINCGLCLNVCKAYETTQNALFSPVGKIGRLIFEEKAYEMCFGCAKDEEVCPVDIPISKLTTEGVNRLSPSSTRIEVLPLPADITETSLKLQNKYRNRPLFLLVTGCASKHDINGIRGFLNYLLEKGDQIPTSYSPRVEIVNECCGFDDFIGGDVEKAKEKVNKIIEIKRNKGAAGVYFLCPEGLYVFNTLSGDKGILAYDVVKRDIKGKLHAGCWAKKFGIKGEDDECAGLHLTTYKGSPIAHSSKDVITICPFSTWKFGTTSVYSYFYKVESPISTEVEQTAEDLDYLLLDIAYQSMLSALDSSIDVIAEKVSVWTLGGQGYFELVTFPLVASNFAQVFEDKIRSNERKDDLIRYIRKIVSNQAMLEAKALLIADYLKGLDIIPYIKELIEKIIESPRLEYSLQNIAKSKEMITAVNNIAKRAIAPKLIEKVLRDVAYL